jgi:asparagine synthase (glutamine-hydrolysing)
MFMGMMSSYMIRHNYIEVNAPTADPDLLEAVMSIPFEHRGNYKLYLKWAQAKYPDAVKFVWEKWGVQPKMSHIFFRKIKTTQKLLRRQLLRLLHVDDPKSMNPMDYWYNKDEKLKAYLQDMYEARIGDAVLPKELADDMKILYETGNFLEKCLVLTVLSAVHNYFN